MIGLHCHCKPNRVMASVLIATAIIAGAFSPCWGHNLDTRATGISFALDYLLIMSQRAALNQPLVQAGDEFWVLLKTTPGPGTNTGVGGYQTFYIPTGVTALQAAFVFPDPFDARGFTEIPAKGQSPIAIGDGPIGAKTTLPLAGLTLPGVNGLGFVTNPLTAAGLHRGTIAGVYGDTGVFYSTDPRTIWNSYGAAPIGGSTPMVNNSGDTVGEWDAANIPNLFTDPNVLGVMTLWDSYQLRAYGRKDVAPIIDYVDGRGNAPWGLANAVAGPESGYAWEFDYQDYLNYQTANPGATLLQKVQAGIDIGPWHRIQYPGSQISQDTPGLISTILGQVGIDASSKGLPMVDLQTVSGINAIRFALGQLELGRPEYSAVKIRIDTEPAAGSCYRMYADAFGGDAGGTDNGKDHLWRYFDPTSVKLEPCVLLQKVASKPLVAPGETFYYTITFANTASVDLPNVVITDTLPSGLTHVSAVPPATTSVSPNYTWNVGTVASGDMVTITHWVKATGTGTLINTASATSNGSIVGVAQESVEVGIRSLLTKYKTVTPDSVAPGDTVTYTLHINNVGTGPTGTPIVVNENLPAGFSYNTLLSAYENGADITGSAIAVNSTDLQNPVFSVSQAIRAGKSLVITFTADVGPDVAPGDYFNYFSVAYEGKVITGIPEAPVTVGGGQIGDTIYRDWNSNGVQDPGEEGIPGVQVYIDTNSNGSYDPGEPQQITDANGYYLFTGLTAGTYTVSVGTGIPVGYSLTDDPDATPDGQTTVTLAENQQYLLADFGYHPAGTGSIGDKVFDDQNKDGVFNGTDVGINGVTVRLYEDTNGNGSIDAGDLQIATTLTAGGGNYLFTGLDPNLSYIVTADDGPGTPVDTHFANPYSLSTPIANLSVSPADFAASPGNSYLNADFGYFGLLPASVGDEVFFDTNGNGMFDVGDSALPNVSVNLYLDANGDGIAAPSELVNTTVTDAAGHYLFDGLAPGNYIVAVDTTDPDLPANLSATKTQWDVTLNSGSQILTADFPFIQLLGKTVSLPYALPGQVLNFTLKPGYPGGELLENVRIVDPLPFGTTFLAIPLVSPNAGGTFGAYAPIPAVNGVDPGPPALTSAITILPANSFVNTPGVVQVTLALTANPAVANVTPTLTAVGGDYTIITGPLPPGPILVPPGGVNFVYTVQLNDPGEYTFFGDADDGAAISWPTAQSASVLSAPDGGPNVVTWTLGSNQPGVPGQNITSGRIPAIYGFRGGNTKEFSRYSIVQNAWSVRAQPTNGIEKGGSLTTDGNGFIYALEGNSKVFYRYDIAADTWTLPGVLANTSDNANEGGAVQFLKVSGTDYVYALLGGSNRFRQYNIGTNAWANMANVPVNVKKGGALTAGTDALANTYLYALQGDGKNGFYRYDPIGNSWSPTAPAVGSMAVVPGPVGWGGALTYMQIGSNHYIYALQGGGKKGFFRYNIATNTWATMTNTPGNVADGGALTNDGTYVYAFQGKTKTFWRYDPATNTWLARQPANFTGNVGQGGALTYDPGDNPQGYFSTMRASPSLVEGSDQIMVTLELYSSAAVANVTPSAPVITATGGAIANLASGPTPASQNVPALTTTTFTWVYNVVPGALPGTLTFSGNATGDAGATTFPIAQSKSVLVSPLLAFQATVNIPPPALPSPIKNTGLLVETSGTIPSATSNTTETATTGSIGDLVWNDFNGNGLQDVGEFGIGGVHVYIDSNSNGVFDPGEPDDFTAPDGSYRIYGLGAGTYTVSVDQNPLYYPAGYLPTTPLSTSVVLAAGQQYNLADFGLRELPAGTGSIGDYIWLDADNDGVQDPTEAGLPNITVKLQVYTDATWADIATTTTDADGLYEFTDLPAGQYKVIVDTSSTVDGPYGGSFTIGGAMSPTFDRDGTGTPNVATVTLPTNSTHITNADFGYNWGGTIGNYVWWDDNTDGLPDPGEAPIAGAIVLLYLDANGDGKLDQLDGDYQIGIDITDANGLYSFTGLPPGDYLVDVYEDSIITDGTRNVVPTTDNVVAVNLPGPVSFLDADFGYYVGARIEGDAFWDVNHDGVQDTGEPLLPGVQVTLTGTDINNNPVSLTATTDANGHYVFIVPEGDYTVSYQQSQLLGVYPDLGDQTTPDSYSFHAYPGEDWHPILDFGVDNVGKIGDTVFADVDRNGSQGPGEAGLAGVTVNLYLDSDGNGTADSLLATQITDPTGFYQFIGLADTTGSQKYMVEVVSSTLPAGYQTTPTADPDAVKDGWNSLTLTGGATINTVDFGYPTIADPGTLYTISGTIFDDNGDGGGTAGNGTQDGTEPGLPGVDIIIELDTDGDGQFDNGTYVVTTDGAGDYSLAGIPPGSDIKITVDEGTMPTTAYVETGDPDGGTPPVDNPYVIDNISGNMTNQDFGYEEKPSSISGTVADGVVNGNGQADIPPETPVAGVLITLYYLGPDGLPGTADDQTYTTNTLADGTYSFGDLLPGYYLITKTNPMGAVSVADADGGDPDSIWLYLPANESVTGEDFEIETPTPAIMLDKTGHLVDIDSSGGYSAGDQIIYKFTITNTGNVTLTNVTISDPVPGVTVNPNPGSIASLAPGASDSTTFTGTYTVTAPDITNGSFTNTATATGYYGGTPVTDNDGDVQQFGGAVISGAAFDDLNGNGVLDPGEPPLDGATFTLTFPGGAPVIDLNGNPVAPQTGSTFNFGNLPPGMYWVAETNPAGYNSTGAIAGIGGMVLTPDLIQVAAPVPGFYPNQDFLDISAGPAILLEKTGYLVDNDSNGVYSAGDQIHYTFTVTNTGNVPLTNITITDPKVTVIGGPVPSLAPGASDSTTFTGTHTVTAADLADPSHLFTNTATVTGHYDSSQVTDTDDDIRRFTGVVISGAAYSDLNGNGVLDPGEPLLPGATFTLTDLAGNPVIDLSGNPVAPQTGSTFNFGNLPPGTYKVTETNPPGFSSTASIAGTGGTVLTNDQIQVAAPAPGFYSNQEYLDTSGPLIMLEKTGTYVDQNGDGIYNVGDKITYQFTVTNTGNATLTNITIADLVAGVTVTGGPIPSLAPGVSNSTTFTGQYLLTQSDIDAGTFTNVATVTGHAGITTVTDTDDDIQTFQAAPAITLEKTGYLVDNDSNGVYSAGDQIHYTFTVTNTGSVTLTNITLNDPIPGVTVVGGPIVSLAPGASDSTTFTGTYTITAADLADPSHLFTNTATVTGHYKGTEVTDEDDDVRRFDGAVISGAAYDDLNGNGVLDPGEPLLPGATFTLTDLAGNPVIDLNGNPVAPQTGSTFNFGNLPPGTYKVTETNPPGFTSTDAIAGTGGTVLTNDQIQVAAPVPGFYNGQNYLDRQGGEQLVYQAYPGNSSGTNMGSAGFRGATGDLTTSVPGILQIIPQDEGEPRWANFIQGYLEGTYTSASQLKNVKLTKQTPELVQCSDVFPTRTVQMQGTANIRTWWPLMYEVPGTTWTLEILWGDGTPPYVHTETWVWRLDATLQSLKDTLQLFHELPYGRTETPLISDENLYPVLQSKLDAAIAAMAAGDPQQASGILEDFEMEVSDAWLTTVPLHPNPTGPGTGIVQTTENPAVCKLLTDAGYIGANGIWATSK